MATGVPISPAHGISTGALLGSMLHHTLAPATTAPVEPKGGYGGSASVEPPVGGNSVDVGGGSDSFSGSGSAGGDL
jgi:hypothetical protein